MIASNIFPTTTRRARGDMIEVYKWVKGIDKGSIDQVIEISSQQGRTCSSNGYNKLDKPRFRTDIGRHYWFTNRVFNDCNRLDKRVVSAESIGSFQKRLDESIMDRDVLLINERGCLV